MLSLSLHLSIAQVLLLAHKHADTKLTLHAKPIDANDSMAICEKKADFLARYCRSCNSINQHTQLAAGWLIKETAVGSLAPKEEVPQLHKRGQCH